MLKQRHKLNFRELVLRCIESSDAEQRRIFHRMLHATTRNKQKTRNRRNKHCFGTSKTGAPRAAHKQHPHLLPNTLSSKGANHGVLLAVHPALRPPRSAPYRGERTLKLGEFIYHLCRANPPKLGRIRVDFEKL